MSRDPLEGVRPQDTYEPDMRPHDALDQPGVMPPSPAAAPGRRSGIAIAVLIVGMACAVVGGALAYYLAAHPSPPTPQSMPTPTPIPTSMPTPTPTPAGETVVQQGQEPSADPSASPATK